MTMWGQESRGTRWRVTPKVTGGNVGGHRLSSDPWGLPKVGQYPRRRANRSVVGIRFTTRDGDGAVTTIRANCPSCGDVQLTADDLTVRVCADDERGSYCFRCPDCQGAVAKEASRRIVDLLVSSGVRMQVWRLPAELSESRVGAPLTPDDLLDFHLLLAGEKLVRAARDRSASLAQPLARARGVTCST